MLGKIGYTKMIGPSFVKETTEQIAAIRKRIQAAQDRQKSMMTRNDHLENTRLETMYI